MEIGFPGLLISIHVGIGDTFSLKEWLLLAIFIFMSLSIILFLRERRLQAGSRNPFSRWRESREAIEYRQALEQITNFVHNELSNGRAIQPISRPDVREWKAQRVRTIEVLNNLRRRLDAVCVAANSGKAVGRLGEFLGALCAFVGAIISLKGLPSGSQCINNGNLANHLGRFIDYLSDVFENYSYEKSLREIEATLARDQQLSQPLAQWLNYSTSLDTSIQAIFGVSLTSGKFNNVLKVFKEMVKISDSAVSFRATMRIMEKGEYSVYIGNDVKIASLEKLYHYVCTFPEFAEKIERTLSVFYLKPNSIEHLISGAKLGASIMEVSGFSAAQVFKGGLKPEIPTNEQVTVYCVFQAINMALSLMSFKQSVGIIKNGISIYSDSLTNIVRELGRELEQMENF